MKLAKINPDTDWDEIQNRIFPLDPGVWRQSAAAVRGLAALAKKGHGNDIHDKR